MRWWQKKCFFSYPPHLLHFTLADQPGERAIADQGVQAGMADQNGQAGQADEPDRLWQAGQAGQELPH